MGLFNVIKNIFLKQNTNVNNNTKIEKKQNIETTNCILAPQTQYAENYPSKEDFITANNRGEILPQQILFFDVETTGLSPYLDDILQLSIIDANGNTLYNGYFNPSKKTSWDSAMRINGITPYMVSKSPRFIDEKPYIEELFNNAFGAFGYNVSFDDKFINANGICLYDIKDLYIFDVLKSARKSNCNTPDCRLITMAEYFGFDYNKYPAHNSLSDVLATKLVAENVAKDDLDFVKNVPYKKYLAKQKEIEKQKKAEEKLHKDELRQKAIQLYGKSSFTYQGIKYDATKDWDEFVKGIENKEYNSRPEVKAEKLKQRKAEKRQEKFLVAYSLAKQYLDLTEEEYYKYYIGGYGSDIKRLAKEVFKKDIQ